MLNRVISKETISMAWLVVLLLFPVALLNYLDRQMIAAMKTSVMSDISGMASESQWGYMLGQFKWSYAFFSPIGGLLADRVSRRWTIGASLVCWSAITFLTGLVDSFQGLLWTRTAMGISEAFYIPAALALISDYHIGPTRSKAVGVHQMGIYCGVILGGFAGYAADSPAVGWRLTFQVIGVIGIAYAVPLLFFLRDVPNEETTNVVNGVDQETVLNRSTTSPVERSVFSELFTNFSFLLLVAYFTLPALSAWIVRDWMPSILKESFDISQGFAGVSATLYWQLAAIFAALFGGWLADRWARRSPRGRIYVSAIGVGLIIPALIGVGIATSEKSMPAAIAALVLFGIGWGFFDCNNMPILCQIVRPNHRATGYGIMNMISISCGGLADWGFGKMLDMKLPMTTIFGAFAACCVVSIAIVLSIRPRFASESDALENS